MTAPPAPDVPNTPLDDQAVAWTVANVQALEQAIGRVLQGKQDVVRLALTCLLAEGHLLIEDVPGLGKTSLARALSTTIRARSHRIQFTPDLLPSDITGVTVFNQATAQFEFRPGGVFANVVIADEINRASPKAQSALLEVMEERAVTVDAQRHEMPRPFLVVATQNPVDLEGTYRLPEAQLDRFLMRLEVGYPDRATEMAIARDQSVIPPLTTLEPVVEGANVLRMIRLAEQVYLADPLVSYIVDLVAATRTLPDVRLGISPRGMLALIRSARSHALISGRNYVLPEDVKALAGPVLAHRLLLTPEAEMQRRDAKDLVAGLLAQVPMPQATAQG
jgi:MoxR-like ATPase